MVRKTCDRCLINKAISDFNKNPGMADGYLGQCKSCVRIALRSYRNKNRAKIRKYQHAWENEGGNREKGHARIREWIATHPRERSAQIVVGNAVRDGKLFKEPCFMCGLPAVAHHPDYDSPLDVVWLCQPHHMQTHKMIMEKT